MGTTKRRNFAPEYKAEAVERLNEPGAGYGSVSADLGITPTQLKTWYLERAAAGSEAALARQKADAGEPTRLRRENKRIGGGKRDSPESPGVGLVARTNGALAANFGGKAGKT